MARRTKIEFSKTYATEANAEKAIAKFTGITNNNNLRYDIMPVLVDGKVRFGVLFFGMNACEFGVHHHFNVVA